MSIIAPFEDKEYITRNEIRQAVLKGDSQVQKFYEDAVILITGGSGFLGKQLIEKLFRSSNIKKIYLLLRPKKGKLPAERLKVILEDPVYEKLYKEKPDFVHKIVPIKGDTAEVKFGIDDDTWRSLAGEVNIILNAAATINFRETMKKATLTNVRAVREMIKFAKDCKNLKSFVHVSTAYSNATMSRCGKSVREDFYESPIAPNLLIELAETIEADALADMMKPLSKDWPNNYTFTKCVAEDLVRTETDLPVCIVRPAIVVSAYREPSIGWIDVNNAFGPSGVILGSTLGLCHTLHADEDIILDLTPVDIVNNAIIVAAWATSNRYEGGDRQPIIYTVTGTRNPLYYGEMNRVLHTETRSLLTSKPMWYCFVVSTKFKYLYMLLAYLLHYIPAVVIDGLTLLTGRKPRLLKTYKMVHDVSSVLSYFMLNDWHFEDGNTLHLSDSLSHTDRIIYNFDMATVNVKDMVLLWSYGVQKYIIKEDTRNNHYALRKQFYLKIVHYIVLPIYLYSLFKIVMTVFLFVASFFFFLA